MQPYHPVQETRLPVPRSILHVPKGANHCPDLKPPPKIHAPCDNCTIHLYADLPLVMHTLFPVFCYYK